MEQAYIVVCRFKFPLFLLCFSLALSDDVLGCNRFLQERFADYAVTDTVACFHFILVGRKTLHLVLQTGKHVSVKTVDGLEPSMPPSVTANNFGF